MAADRNDLKRYLEENAPQGTFSPCVHYDADADALTFFFSNKPEHAKRLNSRVTVYLSDESEDLVGCRIKGVRAVLEDIGSFDVAISHGKVKLKMLFVALHETFSADPASRAIYRQIGDVVRHSDLEVQVPVSV
ncbi:MAG: hypothetical protein HYS13_06605 [Planctomycetia bacterium]|nr:hypothetical protein [Planctomycetia bacterium]